MMVIDFMKLIHLGYLKKDVIGSFDGGIGNFQFMPSTLLMHGVDLDGDGKRDIFNSFLDSSASASVYLMNSNWKINDGFLTEIVLPDNFDYCSIGTTKQLKTIAEWKKIGIKLADSKLGAKYFKDPNKQGWIVVPDKDHFVLDKDNKCVRTRAFIVYPNFNVIINHYNTNVFYATTVGIMYEILSEYFEVH